MIQYNDNDMYVTTDGSEFDEMDEAVGHEFKKELNELKDSIGKLAIKLGKNKNLVKEANNMEYPNGNSNLLLVSLVASLAKNDFDPQMWDYYNSYGS